MILQRMKFAFYFLSVPDFLKMAHLINLPKNERRLNKRGMVLSTFWFPLKQLI